VTLLAALALLATRPTVESVVLERDTARPTLLVTASTELPAPAAVRRDDQLTLTWDADMAPWATAPAPQPPLREIRLAARDGRLVLAVTVDPAVPYGVETDGARVRVVFGATPPAAADVSTLWATLFPAPAEPPPLEPTPVGPGPEAASGEDEDGLSAGRVRLRPGLEAVYISADSTFESPQPIHDDYFELRPRVVALAGLGAGALNADYEARWRRGSAFPESEQTSHFINGALEVPVGNLTVRVADHFAVGTMETREVDPGGEYFFGLGRFRRNRFGVQARLTTASRFRLEGAVAWEALEIDDDAAFFDYDRRIAEARLGYELGPRLLASLAFAHERIPTPSERPLAESTARSVGLELTGELGPRTLAEIAVSLRDQDTPQAAPGGREFTGVVVGARVRYQLGPESMLQLTANRASFPSDFQGNAFYLASGVGAEAELPVPAELTLRLAAGYHWNDYRTTAVSLDEPRRDSIWVGAIGLSRALTRRAWIRADYRRERRDSNLDPFDVRTNAFAVQVGLGFLGPRR
jgi:hypothetical protein